MFLLLSCAGTMNLETQQVQEPPPGYWENVVDHLELQEHQIETLAMGFNSYQQKSKPIISALHSTVSKIRAVLGADETTGDTSMSGEGGASCVPAAAAVGAAGSGTGQGFVHLLQSAGEQDGSGSGNGFACSMPSQSEQALQQQQCGLCSHLSNSSACRCGTGACGNGNGQLDNSMVAAMSKPWQQFGLSHGCLTAETAEDLEQDMRVLMQNVMKLREMHRTVTWLFLNTLNARQHALFITNSWPWWSRPLTSECRVLGFWVSCRGGWGCADWLWLAHSRAVNDNLPCNGSCMSSAVFLVMCRQCERNQPIIFNPAGA